MRERNVDGISPNEGESRNTIEKILEYAERERTVYLPAHDVESVSRLENAKVVT